MGRYKLPKDGAVFSPDKRYRYVLTRKVGPSRHAVTFIMLNPSTADETKDDGTITWCKRFAELEGYGKLWVTNLLPFRATKLDELFEAGPEPPHVWKRNKKWVLKTAARAKMVMLAWGNNGARTDRAGKVLRALQRRRQKAHCLGITRREQPRHPRGVPHDRSPIPFPLA